MADSDASTAEKAVLWALEYYPGYRHMDTDQAYDNESSVGRALAESGVPGNEVFVRTKFNPSARILLRNSSAVSKSVQDTGLIENELLEWQGEQFARVLASGAMHSSDDFCGADAEFDVGTLFEFGLERLLDGNAALIQTEGLVDSRMTHFNRAPARSASSTHPM